MLDVYCIIVNKMFVRSSLKLLCYCFLAQGFLLIAGLPADASLSSVKYISFAHVSVWV